MCGIAGYQLTKPLSDTVLIRALTRAMRHRGPDDEGITLIDAEGGRSADLFTGESASSLREGHGLVETSSLPHRLAFGHRRFSIIDLSPAGHQPFWSSARDVCLSFNGEIYNFQELREELLRLGRSFRTSSDTEVLVEGYRVWGEDCFRRFNGMWAISLYDAARRRLLLARDRLGKIPLYVTRTAEGLFWASEVNALVATLGTSRFTVNEQALLDFVKTGRRNLFFRTLYNEIECLPSASYTWVGEDGSLAPQVYWSIPRDRMVEKEISPAEAVERFTELLADSLRLRLHADVPVGLELSGGMDSSSLVALATRFVDPVRAYTVSFPGTSTDEEIYARQVAQHYGKKVEYNVIYPLEADLLDNADWFVPLMGEPFHSPNLFSVFNIWKLMHTRGIRVCLAGGGGDETLAGYGYDYYVPYMKLLFSRGDLRRFSREFLRYSEHRPGQMGLDYLRRAYHLLPDALRPYRNSSLEVPPELDPLHVDSLKPYSGPSREIEQLLVDNMTHSRMNYWLASGNQASMGIPIEYRLPYLDYRLVEFAFRVPLSYLIRDGWLKWILRKSMEGRLPESVLWRKVKMGFPFPFREWLPASKERFFSMVGRLDCPYLDMDRFRTSYEAILARNPTGLWRYLSVALWWKRCVLDQKLS